MNLERMEEGDLANAFPQKQIAESVRRLPVATAAATAAVVLREKIGHEQDDDNQEDELHSFSFSCCGILIR